MSWWTLARSVSKSRSGSIWSRNVRPRVTVLSSCGHDRSWKYTHTHTHTHGSNNNSSSNSCILGAGVAALCWLSQSQNSSQSSRIVKAEEWSNEKDSVHDNDEEEEDDEDTKLPVYRSSEVAQRDGTNLSKEGGGDVWMSYGGYVYNVTSFVANHPGGAEHILKGAGKAIEPFWWTYRQHFASDLPWQSLAPLRIGRLHPDDQDRVDALMEQRYDNNNNQSKKGNDDPYGNEPVRHPALLVHNDQPMNAEVPANLLTQQYLTPVELFYIRHHHPVPVVDDTLELEIDLSAFRDRDTSDDDKLPKVAKVSLAELRNNLPRHTVVATLQCSGNRRGHFNQKERTSGTPWDQGAISTAEWSGVRLRDLLRYVLNDAHFDDETCVSQSSSTDKTNATSPPIRHVRFEGWDGMKASVPIHKALSYGGDVLIADTMNGQPLPRDHGYPLRVIVPGYGAVRSVKWLRTITPHRDEAEGSWQRGLNYKILPTHVRDANTVDLTTMPQLMEASLFSGITSTNLVVSTDSTTEGSSLSSSSSSSSSHKLQVTGWAWAGGGRHIVRVDVSTDGGQTWTPATLQEGTQQPVGKAWAWTFWTATLDIDIPPVSTTTTATATENNNNVVEICAKAVDSCFHSQPDTADHMWNVRGLGNNSWFRTTVTIPNTQTEETKE